MPAEPRQNAGMATLDEAFDALLAREPLFHRSPADATADDFDAMAAPDFWEVGASGSVYDRATVLGIYVARYADPAYDPMVGLEVSDFAVREAGPGVWLATYRLRQGERLTRRLTVWRETDSGWQVAYHQGTVIGSDAS